MYVLCGDTTRFIVKNQYPHPTARLAVSFNFSKRNIKYLRDIKLPVSKV